MNFIKNSDAQQDKPDISGLLDAFEEINGEHFPLFSSNDIIWIESQSTIFPGRWHDSKRLRVISVDHEARRLTMWDDDNEQHCLSDWETGILRGNLYKLSVVGGVKLEKKRADRIVSAVPHPIVAGEGEKKKGRGRPPGSKNKTPARVPTSKPEVDGVKRGRGRPPGSKKKV